LGKEKKKKRSERAAEKLMKNEDFMAVIEAGIQEGMRKGIEEGVKQGLKEGLKDGVPEGLQEEILEGLKEDGFYLEEDKESEKKDE